MSVNIVLNRYSDLFRTYDHNDSLDNLPTSIINALDDFLDGFSVELKTWNPDDFYCNILTILSDEDILKECNLDPGKDDATTYVEAHFEEIKSLLQKKWVILGRARNLWYVL